MKIGGGQRKDIIRSVHYPQQRLCEYKAEYRYDNSKKKGKGNGCMEAFLYFVFILGTIELAYDHSGSACHTIEEADDEVCKGACTSRDCSQGFFSKKLTHDHCIHCVIESHKKCPEKNREEEYKNLFPDYTFSYTI